MRFEEIDTPQAIVERVERALEHVAEKRLMLTPDCGFSPGKDHKIPLDEAFVKLTSLGTAGRLLRERV